MTKALLVLRTEEHASDDVGRLEAIGRLENMSCIHLILFVVHDSILFVILPLLRHILLGVHVMIVS